MKIFELVSKTVAKVIGTVFVVAGIGISWLWFNQYVTEPAGVTGLIAVAVGALILK
jgi:hypothetical protein